MRVYYGNSGGQHYVMCRDFEEVYSFDTFGNLAGTKGGVSSCHSWVEVDFISIVSSTINTCEVLTNGYKCVVNKPLFEVVSNIRNHGKFLGTMFNILHSDDLGKFNHILFIYRKGVVSTSALINAMYPNCTWNTLNSV